MDEEDSESLFVIKRKAPAKKRNPKKPEKKNLKSKNS